MEALQEWQQARQRIEQVADNFSTRWNAISPDIRSYQALATEYQSLQERFHDSPEAADLLVAELELKEARNAIEAKVAELKDLAEELRENALFIVEDSPPRERMYLIPNPERYPHGWDVIRKNKIEFDLTEQ